MAAKSFLLPILLIVSSIANSQVKLADNIFEKKLANGLEVLVVEDHSVPLATLIMTFKAGSFAEADNTNGLTGLYLSMLENGNRDFKNEQDANYYSGQLGIKLRNSVASTEYATYYFTLPSSNLTAGLNFMNSGIRFPKMDPGELEKEKELTNNQLKQKESNPYFILNDSIGGHLWTNLYSRKKPIGSHEVISAATPASLNVLRDKYFYPNNAVMIVGGDVKPEEAFTQIEKIYGNWAPSLIDPLKVWTVPEFAPLKKTSYAIVKSSLINAPEIELYWQGPDTRHDVASTYAADVFSFIINQNESTLKKALVQSGLATSLSINYLTCKYVGPISLIISPNPEKVKECMDEVKRQLTLMDNENYITQEQIETAKRILEIRKIREEDITSDFVHTLSFWWAAASTNYFVTYNSNLNNVTKNEVENFIRKYITDKPYSAGLLINPNLDAQINSAGFFKQ